MRWPRPMRDRSRGAEDDAKRARDGAVGPVPAQPRRARPRPADRGAARAVFEPSVPTRTCSSTSAASAAGWRRCSDGDRRRLELAYSLMFTLPGTPVIRYGDEIGMGDDLELPERMRAHADAVVDRAAWRLFPRGQAGRARDQRGAYGYEHVNVAKQRRDPNSMLNWTERIVRMRKEVPEVGWGEFEVLPNARPGRAGDPLRLAQQLGAVRA